MEPRISLITLGVDNLQRAVRFYRDGLGWPLSSVSGEELAVFRTQGVVLVLFPRGLLAADAQVASTERGFSGVALAHNVAKPQDVDTVLAEAAAAGATILKPAQAASWGGRSGYFADPDGHLWEVAWNPHWSLGPDGTIQLPS